MKKIFFLLMLTLIILRSEVISQTVKIGYVDKVKVLTDLSSWKNADEKLLLMKENAEFEHDIQEPF